MMIMMMALICVKRYFKDFYHKCVVVINFDMPVEQISIEMANGFNIDRIKDERK